MGVGLESLTIGNRNCSREEKSWASHKLLPSYKTLFVRGRNLALTAVYKCTRDTFYLSPRVLHAGGDALHGDDEGVADSGVVIILGNVDAEHLLRPRVRGGPV